MTRPPPTDDGPIQLYAKQKKVYPRKVFGQFRRLKWLAMAGTLTIYYLAPFIRWDRGPGAPDQAILIDLPARRAYFFFIEIWPQEVYYITGILILAAVALFCITSILGRVWCGYFCPQTVWTDLYMAVERLIQGDRNARIKLDTQPWGFGKLWKKSLTHLIWILIALLTAGAYVFYFNDAPTLWLDILHCDVTRTVMYFVGGLTFSTYLMAGFSREQVCTYMCPYARFQSAMFDEDTLIIGYDEKRGEPRGHHKKGDDWDGKGHCIDCTQCVQVCPTGIDIREGLQNECIACGLCADACDNVMEKLGLPVGLIRYDTANALKTGIPANKFRLLRPRTIYYSALLSLISGIMLYTLASRSMLELHVLHDRNPLFVTLSDGKMRNGYEIKVLNKQHTTRHFNLSVEGLEAAEVNVVGAGDLTTESLAVSADEVGHYHVFVKAPTQKEERRDIVFRLQDTESDTRAVRKSVFISKEARP